MGEKITKQDLRLIYEQYYDELIKYLYYRSGIMDLAEDIVQELFVKLWEKRDLIKRETLKSFLYTMASNMMVNHFKRRKVMYNHQNQITKNQITEYKSPHFILEEKEFENKLNKIISALPDGYREVFLMHRIDEFTYQEIAIRLNIGVKAVEKRMSKSIKIIKEQLISKKLTKKS